MSLQEEKKHSLKELVINDLPRAFECLKEILKDDGPNQNKLLVLERQYAYIQKRQLIGTLTNEEAQARINTITHSILEFIDALTKAEPESFQKAQIRKIKFRKGKTLYNVPGVMEQGIESLCFVRIAFTEDMLRENLQSDTKVKAKEIKVADTMQVELMDPSSRKNFEIRPLTSSEQALEDDSYTEWQFMVTPLQPGEHKLILSIAVIENIDGNVNRKYFTLTEHVNVLVSGSEFTLPSSTPKEIQDITILISTFASLPETDKAIFRPLLNRIFNENLQRGLATIILLCIAITGSIWAIGYYQQEKLWDWAEAQNSINAYEKYIEKHPKGRYLEDAIWKLALLRNTLDEYLNYIQTYPEGKFIEEANYQIALLRNQLAVFYEYLEQFPGGTSREKVLEKINLLYRQSPPNLELSVDNDTLQVLVSGTFSPYYLTVAQSDTTFYEQTIQRDSTLSYPLATFKTYPGNYYLSLQDSVDNVVIDTFTIFEDKKIELFEKQSAIRFLTDSVNIGQVFKGEVITIELPYENISNTAVELKNITLTNYSNGFKKEWYAENVRFDYDHYRDLEEFFSCNKTRDKGVKTFRWEDARRQACPDGWRIPTEVDWESVFRNYGEFDIHTTDTTRTAYNEIVRAGSSKLNLSTDIKYWTDKRIEGDLVSVISLNSDRTQIRVNSENKRNCNYCRCLKKESYRIIRIE